MPDFGGFISPGAALVVILGALVAAVRWARPRWQRFTSKVDAGFESIVGRDAIVNPADGRVISPAVPGIGVRMTNVEDAVALLVANQNRLDDHDRRIVRLEEATIERIVNRADSALAWGAIAAAASDAVGDASDQADDELETD